MWTNYLTFMKLWFVHQIRVIIHVCQAGLSGVEWGLYKLKIIKDINYYSSIKTVAIWGLGEWRLGRAGKQSTDLRGLKSCEARWGWMWESAFLPALLSLGQVHSESDLCHHICLSCSWAAPSRSRSLNSPTEAPVLPRIPYIIPSHTSVICACLEGGRREGKPQLQGALTFLWIISCCGNSRSLKNFNGRRAQRTW